jgi:anti-sigma-K factor RskA
VSHHRHALACDDCRDLLGGYVLDALEPDEMDAVRAHLGTCARCAREHAELAAIPAMLDTARATADVTPAKPPPALEDAVLHSFARDRTRARPRPLRRWLARPLPVAVAAAAAAAVVTLLVSTGLDGSSSSPDHTYSARLAGTPTAPAARAYAKLDSFQSGTRVRLYVKGVRPEPGAVYELWCVQDDGAKMSAGTFRVDDSGRADVRLTTAARLGEYHRLSVERSSGPGARQRVMTGSIEY